MSFKRILRSGARSPCDSSGKNLVMADEVKTEAKALQKPTKSTTSDRKGKNDSPSTPPAKRIKTGENSLDLLQKTPSRVSSYGTSESSAASKSIDTEKPFPNRPAEPHGTNATLKTPGGSRLVPYSKQVVDSSPIKSGLSKPTTTTQHLLEQACAHLVSVDARMKPLIERHHCRVFSPEGLAEELDPFESLCSSIISQQVSGAAAKSIKNKFIGLFNSAPDDPLEVSAVFPTPNQVSDCQIPFLRTAGLSERKAEYIKGLAEKFHCGDLSAKMLIKASDEEVLEKLVAVRGLGRWSVEMFACFALKRMDVLSTGDLGVQRGMAAFIGKDVKKLKAKGGKWKYLSEKEMLDISAPFAPYRSVFMWYMWRVEDVDVDAFT